MEGTIDIAVVNDVGYHAASCGEIINVSKNSDNMIQILLRLPTVTWKNFSLCSVINTLTIMI